MQEPTRKTLMQTGLVTSRAKKGTPMRSWRCRVLSEDGDGDVVALGARPIRVGASKACDLILGDAQVSREHAELSLTPEGIRILDLESTNGTFWQGSRISEVIVPGGSVVVFGTTQVQIIAADTPVLPPSPRNRFGAMVGKSLAMRELYSVLELASPTDVTVLIEGESGTGKELVARALHDHSLRASVPLAATARASRRPAHANCELL